MQLLETQIALDRSQSCSNSQRLDKRPRRISDFPRGTTKQSLSIKEHIVIVYYILINSIEQDNVKFEAHLPKPAPTNA